MDILDLLKLNPKRLGFFMGAFIGLATYKLNTTLCTFQNPCKEPYYFALFLGAILVALYCALFVDRFWRLLVIFAITFLTYHAMAQGIRIWLGDPQDKGTLLSYLYSYGVITLIYIYTLDFLVKGTK